MRTREGIVITKAKGRLRGKQPKLKKKQQETLSRMYDTGEDSIADLTDIFAVSRATIHRTSDRARVATNDAK